MGIPARRILQGNIRIKKITYFNDDLFYSNKKIFTCTNTYFVPRLSLLMNYNIIIVCLRLCFTFVVLLLKFPCGLCS